MNTYFQGHGPLQSDPTSLRSGFSDMQFGSQPACSLSFVKIERTRGPFNFTKERLHASYSAARCHVLSDYSTSYFFVQHPYRRQSPSLSGQPTAA